MEFIFIIGMFMISWLDLVTFCTSKYFKYKIINTMIIRDIMIILLNVFSNNSFVIIFNLLFLLLYYIISFDIFSKIIYVRDTSNKINTRKFAKFLYNDYLISFNISNMIYILNIKFYY